MQNNYRDIKRRMGILLDRLQVNKRGAVGKTLTLQLLESQKLLDQQLEDFKSEGIVKVRVKYYLLGSNILRESFIFLPHDYLRRGHREYLVEVLGWAIIEWKIIESFKFMEILGK